MQSDRMQLKYIKSQLIQVLPYCRRNLSLCWKVQKWVTNCPLICSFTCNKGGAAKTSRGREGASYNTSFWTDSSYIMMGVGILMWGQAAGTEADGGGCLLMESAKSLNLSLIWFMCFLRFCVSLLHAWSMLQRICSNWLMSCSRSLIGFSLCSDNTVLSTKCMDGASLWGMLTLTEGVGLTTGVLMIVEMGVVDLTTSGKTLFPI